MALKSTSLALKDMTIRLTKGHTLRRACTQKDMHPEGHTPRRTYVRTGKADKHGDGETIRLQVEHTRRRTYICKQIDVYMERQSDSRTYIQMDRHTIQVYMYIRRTSNM